MSILTPEDRALLELARDANEPKAADRRRIRGALARELGAGAGLAVAVTIARAGSTGTVASAAAAAGAPASAGGAGLAGLVAGGSVAGAAGLGSTLASVPVLVKVLLVAVALGGSASAYHAFRAPAATPADHASIALPLAASPQSVAPPRGRPQSSAPASALAPLSSASPTAPPPHSQVPRPANVARSAPASPSVGGNADGSVVGPGDGLVAETKLMREAMASLKSGDASRSLALFDQHAREFPNGILAEERGAERALALCELGRDDEAKRAAAVFFRDHPSSRLISRVRASCAGPAADSDGGRSIP